MRRLLILALILALSPLAVLASDVSGAVNQGTITITNNSTAATDVSLAVSINTTSFMNGGFINSSVNNTAVTTSGGNDVAFMPGYGNNPWVIFEPSIQQYETKSDILYTGSSDTMSSKLAYFPDTGMTITDNSTLEWGDNFTFNYYGYIDTSKSNNVLYKEGAARIFTSGNQTITSALIQPDIEYKTGDDGILTIDTDNTTQFAQVFTTPADYFSPIEVNLKVYEASGGTADLVIEIQALSGGEPDNTPLITANHTADDIPIGAADWVTFTIEDQASLNPGTSYALVLYKLNGNNVYWRINTAGTIYTDGTAWDTTDSGSNWTEHTTFDAMFEIKGELQITYTDIISGDTLIANSLEGQLFTSNVSSAFVTTALSFASSVPDTANNWIIGSEATPYIISTNMTIGGTLKGSWKWQYGPTFTDLSGNGNTATPTFRTTGTNANVTANLTDFKPILLAAPTDVTPISSPTMIASTPTAPGGLYQESAAGSEGGVLPLASTINTALDATNLIPRRVFWISIAFGTSVIAGLVTYGKTRSMFWQAVVSDLVLVFWTLTGASVLGTGIIPGWVLIPCTLEILVVILLHRQPFPG